VKNFDGIFCSLVRTVDADPVSMTNVFPLFFGNYRRIFLQCCEITAGPSDRAVWREGLHRLDTEIMGSNPT
jgi:hypothetical protein